MVVSFQFITLSEESTCSTFSIYPGANFVNSAVKLTNFTLFIIMPTSIEYFKIYQVSAGLHVPVPQPNMDPMNYVKFGESNRGKFS